MKSSRSISIKPLLVGLITAPVLAVPSVTNAQDFPLREVRIVVPQAPGGASDAMARLMANKLAERWRQPVVVENKAGANGNIGTTEVAKSAPDGHTLLFTYAGSHVTSPALYSNLAWDPIRDFVAVSPVAQLPFVAVVHKGLKVENLESFIALARTEDGRLNSASPGSGSLNHLLSELFNKATGTKTTHVPYTGISQALIDLIAERVDITFSSVPSVVSHVRSGALQPLAVTSTDRSELLPDVPTFSERGFPELAASPWFGVLAPRGTPQPVLDQLNRDIHAVVQSEEMQTQLRSIGATAKTSAADDFQSLIEDDLRKWSQIVSESNISVQ